MGSGAGSERLAVCSCSCGVALPGVWVPVLLRSTRLHAATSVVPAQLTLDGSSAAHTAATVLPFDFWLPHWPLELGSSSLCVCGWAVLTTKRWSCSLAAHQLLVLHWPALLAASQAATMHAQPTPAPCCTAHMHLVTHPRAPATCLAPAAGGAGKRSTSPGFGTAAAAALAAVPALRGRSGRAVHPAAFTKVAAHPPTDHSMHIVHAAPPPTRPQLLPSSKACCPLGGHRLPQAAPPYC